MEMQNKTEHIESGVSGIAMGSELSHLDLFSGIGGFAIAAKRAGFNTVGFAETDEYASGILRDRFGSIPNYGDVRGVTRSTVPHSIRLLTGGFPCQPFSTAGNQRGRDDDRYLWPEMLRVILETRPAWIIGENVSALVSMGLDEIISDLETNCYACQSFIIPACACDSPQRRDRVWIVANTLRDGWQQNVANNNLQGLGEAEAERMGIKLDGSSSASAIPFAIWPPEPAVGRMVHGVSNRLDIRALGNSIVPEIAYRLMMMIRMCDVNL